MCKVGANAVTLLLKHCSTYIVDTIVSDTIGDYRTTNL